MRPCLVDFSSQPSLTFGENGVFDIPEEALASYTTIRTLPDGQVCGVKPLVFHWTVHVDLDSVGYRDRWCFQTEDQANTALAAWDGVGDMPGDWHKHPTSGRYRNPETGAVWKDGEIEPGSIAGMAR